MPRTTVTSTKRWWSVLALGSLTAMLEAQEPGPTARPFCEPKTPPCERLQCDCLEGGLQVELVPGGGSVREFARFDAGEPVEMTLVLETEDPNVQGWTFGIRHDPRFLTLESVTLEGSDAKRLAPCGFSVLSMTLIEECLPDDPPCSSPIPGGGYVAAFVIFSDGHFIPPGRSSLHHAVYRLTGEDPGRQGTLIEFSRRLKRTGLPVTDIFMTVSGHTLLPRFLIDGLIRSTAPDAAFHRGDPSADGKVTVGDAILTLLFLFRGGGMPPCLEAADFDDDGRLQVTDAVAILQWLFFDRAAPSSPGPPGLPCGPDPPTTPERMGCAEYPGCEA
jgi:hypothetical protein